MAAVGERMKEGPAGDTQQGFSYSTNRSGAVAVKHHKFSHGSPLLEREESVLQQ